MFFYGRFGRLREAGINYPGKVFTDRPQAPFLCPERRGIMNTPATLAAHAVTISNGKAVTTSLEIARTFKKRHDHVLRTIQNLAAPKNGGYCPPDFIGLNFQPYSYIAENGKMNPCYLVTRDGFTLLAMGFTGADAMMFKIAFIEAFNTMESQLKGQTANGAEIAAIVEIVRALSERVGLLAGSDAAPQPPPQITAITTPAKVDKLPALAGEIEQAETLKRWRVVTVENCRRIIRAMDARRKVTGLTKWKAVAILEKMGCTPDRAQKLARTLKAK